VIGYIHQPFELIEIALVEIRDAGVGEGAEYQIHLTDAAVPCAKQQFPPARVQPLA
jgi:hypothetical protein